MMQVYRLSQVAALFRRALLAVLCAGFWSAAATAQTEQPAPEARGVPAPSGSAGEVSYRQHVWPILKRHCWGCHSAANAEGGLKLDSMSDLLKGGDSGPALVPGQPDASSLYKLTVGTPAEMPRNQPPLSAEKQATLRRWIEQGAKDDSLASAKTGQVVIPHVYRFVPAVNSVALSPDGKLIAAACRSEIFLAEAEGEAAVRRLATECELLTQVEFSPDGALLAAVGGSPSRNGEVRFIKVADGSLVSIRQIGGDTLFRGGFSPAGDVFAVGGPDGAVHLVPVDPAQAVRRLELHSDWVLDVAYSPDGQMLVSGGRDKATKVSSVATGELLRALDASPDAINCVATDGLVAVSAGRARTLLGFEFKIALEGVQVTGDGNGARPVNRRDQYLRPFEGQPQEVLDLATSADRKRLAIAGNFPEVRIYDLTNRQRVALIAGLKGPQFGVALNADGSRVVTGGKQGVVQVHEVPSGKLLRSLVPAPVETAAAAPQ